MSFDVAQAEKEYRSLSPVARKAFDARIEFLDGAHHYQLPPDNNHWVTWFLLAGRGSGKTFCASHFTWWSAWTVPNCRGLVLAPTANDLRFTCFEGESGLLNVVPPDLIVKYNISTHELTLKNGSVIRGISGDSYERLRGPQFHFSWIDELAAFQYAEQSWDMMNFGLRLGNHPRKIITSTPKPIPLLFTLKQQHDAEEEAIARKEVGAKKTIYITHATTHDNLENLAPTFQEQIMQYEDTEIGRQEIYAELIDPSESSIFKRSYFKLWSASKPFPKLSYVVTCFDLATSEKTSADYTAKCALGLFKPSEDEPVSVMILDVDRWKCEYVEAREYVRDSAGDIYGDSDEWNSGKKVDLIVVEDASNGTAIIQELSRLGAIPIKGKKPGHLDKVSRAHLVSPVVARGRVYIPESTERKGKPRSWLIPFLDEICTFPNTPIPTGSGRDEPYDDWVDAFVMGLNYLRNETGLIKIDVPIKRRDEKMTDDRKKQNPYSPL